MAWQYLRPELDAAVAPGDTVAIEGDEARHAAVVSRVRVGERIRIVDGSGTAVWGPVVEASRDRVAITVEAVALEPEPSPEVWLVQALAKGDRDELAIQAATELGAAGIVPWQAARSVSRW
ncbi:MAG: RsmE family RNA methyltransferase, partial [Pseudoclavibacter sp.]